MNFSRLARVVAVSVLTILSGTSFVGSAAEAQPPKPVARDGEFRFGPFFQDLAFEGVDVDVPVWVLIHFEATPDTLRLGGRIVGDLSEVQREISCLAEKLPLPADRCERQRIGDVGYAWTTRDERLTVVRDSVWLRFDGRIEVCSWQKVPCLDARAGFLCPENLRARTSFDAEVSASVAARGSTAELVIEDVDVDLHGSLGEIVRFIGNIVPTLEAEFAREVKRMLNSMINPVQLKDFLPEGFLDLDPGFSGSRFYEDQGRPFLELELGVDLDREALKKGVLRTPEG